MPCPQRLDTPGFWCSTQTVDVSWRTETLVGHGGVPNGGQVLPSLGLWGAVSCGVRRPRGRETPSASADLWVCSLSQALWTFQLHLRADRSYLTTISGLLHIFSCWKFRSASSVGQVADPEAEVTRNSSLTEGEMGSWFCQRTSVFIWPKHPTSLNAATSRASGSRWSVLVYSPPRGAGFPVGFQ